MKKVVYVLGAGASFQALPIVSDLPQRFEFFCKHFFSKMKVKVSEHELIKVRSNLEELRRGFYKQQSVDTHARMLYYKDRSKYTILKHILTAFFVYEQLENSLSISEFINTNKNDIRELLERINLKSLQNNYDNRYTEFLTRILVGKNWPENVHIISWNYDMQVEKALCQIWGGSVSNASKALGVIGNYCSDYVNLNCHLIKMNGTAKFVDSRGESENLFDFEKHSLDEESWDLIIKEISRGRFYWSTQLRFAWEEYQNFDKIIDLAYQWLREADAIIAIGYSFPDYNREIDVKLFNDIKAKVFIQGTENDKKYVLKNFSKIHLPYPEYIDDCRKFQID